MTFLGAFLDSFHRPPFGNCASFRIDAAPRVAPLAGRQFGIDLFPGCWRAHRCALRWRASVPRGLSLFHRSSVEVHSMSSTAIVTQTGELDALGARAQSPTSGFCSEEV
jgi:hypothetical protein